MIPREAMTTRTARRYINALRDHVAWLAGRIGEKKVAGRPTGYEEEELDALGWALELCENEWHALARKQPSRLSPDAL